ncbi:MAG TPA: DinB family protein [Acidimicrobiales bacterium]|nr:DinB family protein [Acidimicrobiales bacterium]
MDLHEWIVTEHDGVRTRFVQSVRDMVPVERWKERPGHGGSSIAYLVFHVASHQDIAVSSVLAGQRPLRLEWATRLGLGSVPADQGLGETEVLDLTDALALEHLDSYAEAVAVRNRAVLDRLDADALDVVPDAGKGLGELAGVDEGAAPWLFRMWDGKPTSFFVSWEDIGHGLNHLGEMVSVRNRMGLSPF